MRETRPVFEALYLGGKIQKLWKMTNITVVLTLTLSEPF